MVGLYAGSFNPFHKGHLNVLEKAEAIFGRVIIARGQNPEKEKPKWDFPECVKDREIMVYGGLLTDFIDSLDFDVTLIRGLRNANDLAYEMNQYRFLRDMKPDIKVVSILCDPEFEHISSSAIRMLYQYGKAEDYLLK
jgi:pantetheine-phosphate adenylyltransferase